MRTVYDIVRVKPDKSTELIQTVASKADIPHLVETPQYVGTWINDNRKLLRYGRGEIRIKQRVERQELGDRATIEVDGKPAYLFSVRNAGNLLWIVIAQKHIIGYNILKNKELWKVGSITELSGHIEKEMAYQCALAYDTLTEVHKLKSYM
jgi:hypothetical protein